MRIIIVVLHDDIPLRMAHFVDDVGGSGARMSMVGVWLSSVGVIRLIHGHIGASDILVNCNFGSRVSEGHSYRS